jgi:hypothetical protein
MPLAVFLAGASESDPLIQSYVIPDDRGFADDNSKSMIDEQPV